MLVMYDSIDPSQIPHGAQAVAGYVGGAWPTFAELQKDWPHAHRLSIAVNASEDADCLDIEAGDATPQEAAAWFHRQKARGVPRPALYCSLSVVAAVEAAMQAAGVQRHEYRVWSAHYTGVAHICGAACGLRTQADATQWTDHALGRNLDESLCSSDFFGAPHHQQPHPLAVLTQKERDTAERYDHLRQHPHLHQHELARTMAILVRMRKEIWLAAHKGLRLDGEACAKGWGVHHRRERYKLLLARTR